MAGLWGLGLLREEEQRDPSARRFADEPQDDEILFGNLNYFRQTFRVSEVSGTKPSVGRGGAGFETGMGPERSTRL